MKQQKKLSMFKRVWTYFSPYKWWIAFSFFCVTIVSASGGATAYLVKPILDDVFISKDRAMLRVVCLLAILIYGAKGVFRYFNAYLLRAIGQKVIATIRDQLYRHYQFFSLDYYTETQTGVMMSRITNDVQLMQRAVPAVVDFIRQPLTMIGFIAVALYMSWEMSLIAVVILPVTAVPIVKFGQRVRKWARRGQERMGELTSILKENFSGIRVIKAFGTEEYEIRRFSGENEKVRDALIKQVKYDELAAPMIEFLGAIGAAAVLFFGGQMVFRGELTTGEFFSFIAAGGMMYEPIKKLNKVNVAFQQALSAADRIFEILDTDTSITDKDDAYEIGGVDGRVQFDHVRFRYQDEWVLHDVDFVAEPGQTVALVGASGAGKSTLVDLIPRFYEAQEGAVRVDGHDVRDVTMESLRQQIAVVTQDIFLFDDSIAGNIAYGQGGADREAVESAARAANAHDFILALPKGYDTRIGERGVRLSGGQRQRISIARALYKDAPILILDEATSSLDTESEMEVQAALERLMEGRTTFVIAHRLSTIRGADRILVLSGGRIVEDGRHDELMERDGHYKRLYQLQFRDQ